jgi:MYXO-CTERM domain-containing protein
MSLVAVAVVLSSMHYEGDVTAAGGDYAEVEFVVPAGTVEIQISHSDGSDNVILDWGVWSPDGFRGWGGGLTDDAVIGIEQSSRGYLPGAIMPGTWRVVIGKARLEAGAGRYSIDVVCRDDVTLPAQPRAAFDPVVLDHERRWYRGDFHVHSRESGDASATLSEIAALAKQRGLDFVNLSDHNTSSQYALQAAFQATMPDLLLLRGSEITTYAGHGNSVGTSAYVDHRLGHMGRTVAGIIDEVTAQGGVFVVNHPMLDLGDVCIGCAWRLTDETPWEQVAALELITGNFEIGVNAFVPRVIELWDQLLDAGHRIAIVGGSDDHRAGNDTGPTASPIGSPTTLVYADNLGEAAIVKAVREGRTIVQLRGPDDPLVELAIGEARIGDELAGIAKVEAIVRVVGGPDTFAQLWRDGAKIAEQPVTTAEATLTFRDTPGAGRHRYRVELQNDFGQRIVVTSHIYVDAIADDGCGCRASTGATSWLLALVGFAGLRSRRRPAGDRRRAAIR